MKYLLIVLIASLPFISCKTQKKMYTPDTYDREIISWGSGGGFSGKVKSFSLLRNGQMFRNSSSPTSNETGGEMVSLEDKVVDQLFLNFVNLKLAETQLDDLGNMYKWINYRENGNVHSIKWGGKNEEVPRKVKDFYKILSQLANKNKGLIK